MRKFYCVFELSVSVLNAADCLPASQPMAGRQAGCLASWGQAGQGHISSPPPTATTRLFNEETSVFFLPKLIFTFVLQI